MEANMTDNTTEIMKNMTSLANVLENSTTSSNKTNFFVPSDMPTIKLFSIFAVIGILANLVVFITLFRNRKCESRCNRFILHLSLADLLVMILYPAFEIQWAWTVQWKLGDFVCRMYKFVLMLLINSTSFILVVISIDRLIAVKYPMILPSMAKKNGKVMLAIAWALSALAAVPQVSLLQRHDRNHQGFYCHHKHTTGT